VKLFIVGQGRHGKDTVAEFVRKAYGLTFESSSMFCAEHVVTPWLEKMGITYDSLEECYEDRVNHRMDWYEAIRSYNKEDESKLSRAIFAKYDMYVGIRSRVEFLEARHFSDLSIWVEAADRWPAVDPSCKILKEDCDVIVDNNGTIEELYCRLTRLFNQLQLTKETLSI
jgi:hypothetical protein